MQLLRGWLDTSSISVSRLYGLLTEEHFNGPIPTLRRLRAQLNGDGLTLELAEAVADICFPRETGDEAARRLALIRDLWTAGCLVSSQSPSDSGNDLVRAQQRTIEALEELNLVRQAYEVSEQARLQALQAATLLVALLGQTQAQVAQLTRQLDAIRGSTSPQAVEETQTASRLLRAQNQTEELRVQLARAEAERDRAQQVADLAARQIGQLEAELNELRLAAAQGGGTAGGTLLLPEERATEDDIALDRVDATLSKVRVMLDREHDAVQSAAEDVGWVEAETRSKSRIVVGEATSDRNPPDDAEGSAELFRTTSHNPSASKDGSAPLALPAYPSPNIMSFVGAATRRVSRGIDPDEIVLGLCRASVPTFSDEILVYLRDPLPGGDERPVAPFVLRLRRTERMKASEMPGEEHALVPDPDPPLAFELSEVRSGGALAEVLRGVRPVFGDSAAAREALGELLGTDHPLPGGLRAILAPLRGRRRVIGAAV
ncbi:hypothetical protein ACFUJ0_33545, partial [Streptomyces sp. NPDC057242]